MYGMALDPPIIPVFLFTAPGEEIATPSIGVFF